jgi:hypothetical protein
MNHPVLVLPINSLIQSFGQISPGCIQLIESISVWMLTYTIAFLKLLKSFS